MSQTETAVMINYGILVLFGGPFFLGFIEAVRTGNEAALPTLGLMALFLSSSCLLVLLIGAWLDGLH